MDKFLGTVGLAMRAGKAVCGAFASEKAVLSGRASVVIAAENIGANNKRRLEGVCAEFGIPLIYHGSADDLSRSVGKKNVPVVCICDDNFAKAFSVKGKDGLPNE